MLCQSSTHRPHKAAVYVYVRQQWQWYELGKALRDSCSSLVERDEAHGAEKKKRRHFSSAFVRLLLLRFILNCFGSDIDTYRGGMISNLARTPFSFKLLNKHQSYEGNRGCSQNDSLKKKKNQGRIVTFQLLVIEADLMAWLLEHCTGNWRVMGTLFSFRGGGSIPFLFLFF